MRSYTSYNTVFAAFLRFEHPDASIFRKGFLGTELEGEIKTSKTKFNRRSILTKKQQEYVRKEVKKSIRPRFFALLFHESLLLLFVLHTTSICHSVVNHHYHIHPRRQHGKGRHVINIQNGGQGLGSIRRKLFQETHRR